MSGGRTMFESTVGAAELKPGVMRQQNSGNHSEMTEGRRGDRRNGGHPNRRHSTTFHPCFRHPCGVWNLSASPTRSFALLRSGLYSVVPSALSGDTA